MASRLNLEQLRKQAKERVRARRAAGEQIKLADAQHELAREHGFASWPKLKEYVERLGRRAAVPHRPRVLRGARRRHRDHRRRHGRRGAARSRAAARLLELARAHASRRGAARRERAAVAVRARVPRGRGRRPCRTRRSCSTGTPSSSSSAARTATTCSAWRTRSRSSGCCSSAAPIRTAATTTAGRSSIRRATRTRRELAQVMLDAGGRLDLSARGDGGTPLIAALFWGHREVVDLLGREPGNLRVAAGLGDLELIRELAGTPAAGAHREFYRPHGGFPAWQPSDDPQEVLDEGLVWAAKADRVDALPLLVELGARRRRGSVPRHRARVGGGQRAHRVDPRARRARCGSRTSAARSAARRTERA